MTDHAIAFIGLGKMGVPMARRLMSGGYSVVGYDAAGAARTAARDAGIPVADDLLEAVGDGRIVILMLPNSDIVESVVHEMRERLATGRRIIDMSSSDPMRTRDLAASFDQLGVELVDAPVSGGVAGAEAGTLAVMAGGDPGTIDELRPILSCLGQVFAVGPIGCGHAIKALNNLLSATTLWLTSEAVLAAVDFGMDPDVALAVFNSSSGRSVSSERKWPNFIRTGTFDSGFALRLMAKDVGIAVGLLNSMGRPSPLASVSYEGWLAAADALEPNADHTAVAVFIEELLGESSARRPAGA